MIEVTKEFLEEIEQDIAILRDSEFHICNYELSQQMEDEGNDGGALFMSNKEGVMPTLR